MQAHLLKDRQRATLVLASSVLALMILVEAAIVLVDPLVECQLTPQGVACRETGPLGEFGMSVMLVVVLHALAWASLRRRMQGAGRVALAWATTLPAAAAAARLWVETVDLAGVGAYAFRPGADAIPLAALMLTSMAAVPWIAGRAERDASGSRLAPGVKA